MIKRQGMFGPVVLRDTAFARELLINGQVQGGAYFHPSAADVNEFLPDGAPGPACSSLYSLGWLLAGLANPFGSGIMLGLGSGAGAVQLLYNFPGVDLTIVEIDPTVVGLALRGYPLLEYYLNKGRLNIEVSDAKKHLIHSKDTWDFACVDVYTGEEHLKTSYLPDAIKRADNVYLNVIDKLNGPSMSEVMSLLNEGGKPVKEIFKPTKLFIPALYSSMSNWILTTQDVPWEEAALFEPFPEFDDKARDIRREWDVFLSSALSTLT